MKMNVLFVITNINGTYANVYSFGLASIASITREKGFSYDFAIINKLEDYQRCLDLIKILKPKIVAYTSVSSQFMFVKEISEKIREKFREDIIQVCGGVHTTIFPESILETNALDGIFIGESELAFSDFLDRVVKGLPYKDVKNFAYSEKGRLIKNSLYPLLTNLDNLPFPERNKYGYGKIIKRDGYPTFMFSRGCPYSCAYCSNHAIAKTYGMPINKPRYRNPSGCIQEIKQLSKNFSFNKIFVVDDIFGLDKNWLREFCMRYAEEIKLPLMCVLRVNLVNEELMKYLKLAGCVHVLCGVESGNAYIRNEIMKRNIANEQIVKAFSLFKKYGMTSTAINMIGLPHETIENIWDTIKLNRKIKPTSSGINIFYPYRGTKLGDYCFENGLVDKEQYYAFSNERRESVLKFPPKFKEKLCYFKNNWDLLVFKNRPVKFIKLYARTNLKKKFPFLWNMLMKLKHGVTRY